MSQLPPALFANPLPGLDRTLTEPEGELLHNYMILLRKWQKTDRLVGSTETQWIVDNVFLDSFAFLAFVPTDARMVADIGSGAGIPGVPIAIVRPDLRLTMIEARRKRASFLSTVVRELDLAHAEVVNARAEDLGADYRSRFDVALARCVAKAETIVPLAMMLVRSGGTVIVTAGPETEPHTVAVEIGQGEQRRFRVHRKL